MSLSATADSGEFQFAAFFPPTGRYVELPPLDPKQADALREWVRTSGLRHPTTKAAYHLIDCAQASGQRIQVSGREIAEVIGRSTSSGGRCIRNLRDAGFLHRKREAVFTEVEINEEYVFIGKAAVHDITPPPGLKGTQHTSTAREASTG